MHCVINQVGTAKVVAAIRKLVVAKEILLKLLRGTDVDTSQTFAA